MSTFKKLKPLFPSFSLFFLIVITSSCHHNQTPIIPLPSGSCKMAWADSAAFEFVDYLEAATKDQIPVWPGYRLGNGAVVLDAGMNTDSTMHCLGLWHKGTLKAYLESEDGLLLATPLYGYQLSFNAMTDKSKNDILVRASQQPAPIANWLNEHQLESAVLMPVDFPKFPFKIPAMMKAQTAIHESFHIETMLRYWYTGKGHWPAWDEQPDRNGSRQCYSMNEEVINTFQQEKTQLIAMINALLDEKATEALDAGKAFIELRAQRYDLLGDYTLLRQDSSHCDCREAENIMELEEGLADYGSWTMLFEIGVSSRAQLIQRYSAQQKEPFYLTGAMLMHALSLMNQGETESIIEEIVESDSHLTGSVASIFERNFKAYQQKHQDSND